MFDSKYIDLMPLRKKFVSYEAKLNIEFAQIWTEFIYRTNILKHSTTNFNFIFRGVIFNYFLW